MPITEVNRLPVHYQSMGYGPDLVMIHGLFSNLAFWFLSVVPLLVRDFRVIIYDLRGHGYSGRPASGYTSADMADDLYQLLDHLGIKRAHLVGHSFGGAVALHFAALHPDRVRSLTLADARVPGMQPPLQPREALHWRRANARLQRAGIDVPRNLPRVAYSYFEELARLPQGRRGSGVAGGNGVGGFWKGRDASSRALQNWNRLMRTTTARKDLEDPAGLTPEMVHRVKHPTLMIFGRRSDCLPTLRRLKHCIPHGRSVLISGVGHFHPVLKTEIFVEHLRRFLTAVEGE